MNDRLEEIKKRYIRETMDHDTAWLIAEVERLRCKVVGHEVCQKWSNKEIESLQSQLAQMETERNNLRSVDLSQREALQELENKLAAVGEELAASRVVMDNQQTAIEKCDNKLAEAEEFIESQSKDICGYLNKIAMVEKKWDGAEKENAKLEEQVEELENPSIEVKSIQCDRCGEILVNIPKLQLRHQCNDPAQGSGRL
ncbi:hypothetical protein LCGC14_0650240 [marine sediment metagenome]|uniref:Uncharacterized protein n=1 Tax=marine sediment metagenome TaxID=412755 RepID=A0A0F9QWH1_9ZZZZ|nr:hypothetical protein [Candidatus Aminicenantes bacterium]